MQPEITTFIFPTNANVNFADPIPNGATYVGLHDDSSILVQPISVVSFGTVFSDADQVRLALEQAKFKPVGYRCAKAFQSAFPGTQRERPVVVLGARWSRRSKIGAKVLVFPTLGHSGTQGLQDLFVVEDGRWESHATFLVTRGTSNLVELLVVRMRLLVRFLLRFFRSFRKKK